MSDNKTPPPSTRRRIKFLLAQLVGLTVVCGFAFWQGYVYFTKPDSVEPLRRTTKFVARPLVKIVDQGGGTNCRQWDASLKQAILPTRQSPPFSVPPQFRRQEAFIRNLEMGGLVELLWNYRGPGELESVRILCMESLSQSGYRLLGQPIRRPGEIRLIARKGTSHDVLSVWIRCVAVQMSSKSARQANQLDLQIVQTRPIRSSDRKFKSTASPLVNEDQSPKSSKHFFESPRK